MIDFIRLTSILTLVAVLAGGALSYTYTLTKPIIETNRIQQKLEMLVKVLPPFDNRPEMDALTVQNRKGEEVTFYVGKKGGELTGVAFRSITQGYAGDIAIMIGVTPEGKVHGINILSHKETPGLGDRITREPFLNQFTNKTYGQTRWEIKKAGGDFDHITAATVSARAVIKGVQESLSLFQSQVGEIVKTDQGTK